MLGERREEEVLTRKPWVSLARSDRASWMDLGRGYGHADGAGWRRNPRVAVIIIVVLVVSIAFVSKRVGHSRQ